MRKTITVATVLFLAACSGGSDTDDAAVAYHTTTADGDATESAAPDRANMGAPMMGDGELGSDAVMQGQWFDKPMGGEPAALFGPPESEARFSVRCADGELVFTRSLSVEGATIPMHLMAGGTTRTVSAEVQHDPLPQVTARLPADDPFATTLGNTTEPIAVAAEGGPSYRMPSSDVMRRVVSACG